MKVLVIGNGGREHALAWRLAQCASVAEVICPNGNPGIATVASTPEVKIDSMADWADYAIENEIDLVVPGPEAPLAAGVTDACEAKGLNVFGPSRAAAQLESSKTFSKEVMREAGVPTASFETFDSLEPAFEFAKSLGLPVVVKADGLAAGKGVSICETEDQLLDALRANFDEKVFGTASERVLIEEFMEGEEASVFALCDGQDFHTLVASQDHKRAYDGDQGPNTGGMGAYAPAPVTTPDIMTRVEAEIIRPTLDEMNKRGIPYKGVLYVGLMITKAGPKVVEFNCRFGDPETQVVLPLVEGDLAMAMVGASEGLLAEARMLLSTRDAHACCVVQASEGYPGSYEKGKAISGLDAGDGKNQIVFHAGTKAGDDSTVLTNGGRVLGLTGVADDLKSAVELAYSLTEKVSFEGCQFRRDIAHRALSRSS